MNFLHFGTVSLQPHTKIGQLCKELNNIVGQDIYYDTFNIPSTNCLWFVNDILAFMKNIITLCCCFVLFPGYVAGILNLVRDINFYVVSNKILNYVNYIKQFISEKVHYFSHRKLFPVNVWQKNNLYMI